VILLRVHDEERTTALRIDALPAEIGRSMHCPVWLENATISAKHARLERRDGVPYLVDLGSRNGIVRAQGGERLAEVALTSNVTLWLGEVRIEFVVEEELGHTRASVLLTDRATVERHAAIKAIVSLPLAFVALALVPIAGQYRLWWPPERPFELAGTALELWASVVGVGFVLSLFAKLNTRRFQFHRLLALLVAATLAGVANRQLAPTIAFNLHNFPGARWVEALGYAVIVAATLTGLMRLGLEALRPRTRRVIAAVAAVAAVVVVEGVRRGGLEAGGRDEMRDLGVAWLDPRTGARAPDELVVRIGKAVVAVDAERVDAMAAKQRADESEP
jgi:hypothetical protein